MICYRAWTVNTTLSCSQRASEMSTWMISFLCILDFFCTFTWGLLSVSKILHFHLKTVCILATGQPHSSLTSSPAYLCHHLWKIRLTFKVSKKLFDGVHNKPHVASYDYHICCGCIRKMYNKILAWFPDLLCCPQWHHFQQSRKCQNQLVCTQGAPGGTSLVVCLQPMKRTKPVVFPGDTSSRSTRRFCILRELNHNLWEKLGRVKLVFKFGCVLQRGRSDKQLAPRKHLNLLIFRFMWKLLFISKWKIYLKVMSSWG